MAGHIRLLRTFSIEQLRAEYRKQYELCALEEDYIPYAGPLQELVAVWKEMYRRELQVRKERSDWHHRSGRGIPHPPGKEQPP